MYFFSDDCRLNPIDASPSYCTGSPYTQMTVCHLDKLGGHIADPNMQQHISLHNLIILAHPRPGAVFHPYDPRYVVYPNGPSSTGTWKCSPFCPCLTTNCTTTSGKNVSTPLPPKYPSVSNVKLYFLSPDS